jgi:hypothetical protein
MVDRKGNIIIINLAVLNFHSKYKQCAHQVLAQSLDYKWIFLYYNFPEGN